MKVLGDIEGINLSTGERWQRVAGDGESRLLNIPSRGAIDDARLGPRRDVVFGPIECDPTIEEIVAHAKYILSKRSMMHYRNGREAKNGDRVVKLDENGNVVSFGVLHSAVAGNDYCNGNIAVIQSLTDYACLVDCLHVEDVAAILKEKGLEKRPSGK